MKDDDFSSVREASEHRLLGRAIEYDRLNVSRILMSCEERLGVHHARRKCFYESTARRLVDAYIIYAATGRASEDCSDSRPERDFLRVSLPVLVRTFIGCTEEKAVEYAKAIRIASRAQFNPTYLLNDIEFYEWDIEEWVHNNED